VDTVVALVDAALAAGLGSAAAVSVGDARREVFRVVRGSDRRGGAPVDEASWWDLASVTKPMATATLAMALTSARRLDLDAEVRRWFPDATTRGTVRDLLGHAAGYPAHVEFWKRPPAPLLPQCLHEPATTPPVYSDVGFIILAELLARVAGSSLADAVRGLVAEPFELAARFGPIAEHAVATEGVCGVVHDENARLVGGGACGHAGLFATIDALARFACAMLDLAAGVPRGGIDPAVFDHFATTSAAPGFHMRLGWDTPSRVPGVSHAGEKWPRDHAIGHLGFTGTSLWLDLPRGRYVALLTNRIHPTREGTHEPIKALRRAVADAVVDALTTA
jgi:CubicO group peptidase (beta-lactamase class C family)